MYDYLVLKLVNYIYKTLLMNYIMHMYACTHAHTCDEQQFGTNVYTMQE